MEWRSSTSRRLKFIMIIWCQDVTHIIRVILRKIVSNFVRHCACMKQGNLRSSHVLLYFVKFVSLQLDISLAFVHSKIPPLRYRRNYRVPIHEFASFSYLKFFDVSSLTWAWVRGDTGHSSLFYLKMVLTTKFSSFLKSRSLSLFLTSPAVEGGQLHKYEIPYYSCARKSFSLSSF